MVHFSLLSASVALKSWLALHPLNYYTAKRKQKSKSVFPAQTHINSAIRDLIILSQHLMIYGMTDSLRINLHQDR